MVPGLFATAGLDKTVRLWLVKDDKPVMIASREMKEAGSLYAMSFYTDEPFVIAAGGDKGKLAIWDTMENETVAKLFGASLPAWKEARAKLPRTAPSSSSTPASAAVSSATSSSATTPQTLPIARANGTTTTTTTSSSTSSASSAKKSSKPKSKAKK
jgi:WD40 repeat protein